jgi:hypothetical protein
MAVLTQEEYLRRFRAILEQMFDLTSVKNHDYAREDEALANFKEFGSVGVLIRISDKFQRIKNALWFKRSFVVKESIEDTMLDQAVYSVILLVLHHFELEQADLAAREKYPLKEVSVKVLNCTANHVHKADCYQ